MIPPRLLTLTVHTLLHDSPVSVIRDDETVQIEIEAVLQGGAVHLGNQPAHVGQCGSVKPDLTADGDKFNWCLPRVPATSSANADSKVPRQRGQPALKSAHDARGDPRRVPV